VWVRQPPEPWVSALGVGFLAAPAGAVLITTAGGWWIVHASPPVRRWALLALATVVVATALAFLAYGTGWYFWSTLAAV
jgi:hypothetical protein